ncbi:MAG: tyrosine-protein phosphatase [Planctomycetota bacterium]|nr:tyrosine-protein phosphatase [Planctomycetota bacterium]
MKKKPFLTFLAGAVVGAAGMYVVLSYSHETGLFSANRTRDADAPHGRWSKPMEATGLPNLHRVTKDLYRGAQPTAEGMKKLKEMGVKTIINLRSFHSDRDEIGDTGLGYEHIYMKAWHPERKELVRFLKIATDPDRTPVFVHCQYGSDRTGTMCAVYRVAVCGWSQDEALDEMTKGGFGFHGVWDNLVEYLRKVNIDEIKKDAGIQ